MSAIVTEINPESFSVKCKTNKAQAGAVVAPLPKLQIYNEPKKKKPSSDETIKSSALN